MGDDRAALTERELDIVRAVSTGATNQQIARELSISVNTVKVHLKNIFAKLGIESRTEVALFAVREGLVEVETPPSPLEQGLAEVRTEPRERISWQKRLVLVVAMVGAAALVMLPRVEMSPAEPPASEFEDVGASEEPGSRAVQASRWNVLAPLPTARSRLAAVYGGGRIYVIGGDTPDGATGALEEYDVVANSWSVGSPKPIPAYNIGAALVGGRIYVPGGYAADGHVIADLEIYDLETDTWVRGASMPRPLCAYAIASLQDKVYVFGGWNGTRYVASTLEYDPGSDSWTERRPMSLARGFAAAGVVNGKIYVVGGYDGGRELALVEEYDPAGEGQGSPWQERSDMSTGRGGLSVAAIAGSLYAIGGGWNGYLAFNEKYDPGSDRWSPVETPVFGQWRNLAVVASETRIYALGGWNGDFSDANQEYLALFTYYLPEVR
jgi:DNA-binding CsgD family transcriptional regulator/N-acetylneuraminic acid mutarotase